MRALFVALVSLAAVGVVHAGPKYVDPAIGWYRLGTDRPRPSIAPPGSGGDSQVGASVGRAVRVLITGDELAVAQRIFLTGGRIFSLQPGLVHAELTAAQVDFVAASDALERLQVARKFKPSLDVSRAAMHAEKVQAGVNLDQPYTGKGVIVGVVDTGIDISHPAFVNRDGSTRILSVWDQTVEYDDGSRHPAGFAYGVECAAEDINRYLRGASAIESCVTDDGKPIDGIPTEGHGTHVAGIAVSDEETYRGIAPGASLIVVRAHFEEGSILDGVSYVLAKCKAFGRPCVINLSLGTTSGAHDGTSLIEQILSARTGPGRFIVAAAGNEATPDDMSIFGHAALQRGTAGGLRKGPIFFPDSQYLNNDDYSAVVEMWSSGQAVARLHITAAEIVATQTATVVTVHNAFVGTFVEPPANGSTYTEGLVDSNGKVWAYVHYATSVDPANDRRSTVVLIDRCPGDPCSIGGTIDGAVSSFSQRYFFVNVEDVGGDRIDMWPINTSGWFYGPAPVTLDFSWPGRVEQTHDLVGGDANSTITIPSTAADVIGVGSYVTKTSWVDVKGAKQAPGGTPGGLSVFSSRGPATDGRVKPDVAAPGEWITSAHSKHDSLLPSAWSPAEEWVNLQGTSMAAPHVSGLIALMLERNNRLSPRDLVGPTGLMTRNTHTTSGSGTLPNTGFGYGAVDATAVFADSAFAAKPDTDQTAPKISNIKVTRNGSAVTVSWKTNEPANSAVELSGDGKSKHGSEASFVQSHRLRVTGLGDTDYAVRVESADLAGNLAGAKGPTAETSGCGCFSATGPAAADALPLIGVALFGLILRRRLAS